MFLQYQSSLTLFNTSLPVAPSLKTTSTVILEVGEQTTSRATRFVRLHGLH